jgi:hypothetical protein
MMVRCTARAIEDGGPGSARTGDASGVARLRGRRRGLGLGMALLAAWTVLSAGAAIARDSAAPLRIPLAPMGYQALAPEFLLAGSSVLTVDFVDQDHLLISFSVRRLMKREVGDPSTDDDRTVGAFLVELPSGKVLAKTEWRVHDRGQYLWNLGHGRFLLRVRDRLTMFAPMNTGDSADPFREVPLLRIDRHIVAIMVSSDDDLLTIESTKFAMGSGEASEGFSIDPAPVQINFYRLVNADASLEGLRVISAGVIRTRTAVALPMTTAGSLEVLEGGKNRWLFNFDEHAGKVHELAEWDTTCFPHPTFVGHSEFVAFGCRGGVDKQDIAGFNLKGEEMWQQNFFDTHVNPTFAFAPSAGRFALSRTIVSSTFDTDIPLPASAVTAQEVRVYQSYDGKQLFKIECTPVERAGQNFALSKDGMRLAVVRETMVRHGATKLSDAYTEHEAAVEVYTLPPLTDEDHAALKAEDGLAPEDSGARIDLALMRASVSGAADKTAGTTPARRASQPGPQGGAQPAVASEAETSPEAGAGTPPDAGAGPMVGTGVAGTGAAGAGVESGSGAGISAVVDRAPPPSEPRTPPTLYGPDDKPPKKAPK